MNKENRPDELHDIVKSAPTVPILNMMVKTLVVTRDHKKILVSISGGSDSDILLDLIHRFDLDKKAIYVFFNTGLEYEATKKHLKELEKKYGISIGRDVAGARMGRTSRKSWSSWKNTNRNSTRPP